MKVYRILNSGERVDALEDDRKRPYDGRPLADNNTEPLTYTPPPEVKPYFNWGNDNNQ